MLLITLITLLMAVPLLSTLITPSLFNRITAISLMYSALLSYNCLYSQTLVSGVGIYSGLFHVSTINISMEIFVLVVAGILLLAWAKNNKNMSIMSIMSGTTPSFTPMYSEYSLVVLFSLLGTSLLIASNDLVSMYLSLELQSFGAYILTALYRDRLTATSAGLKYFLLGGLSSAIILLGTALVYSYTGTTQLESVYSIVSLMDNTNIGLEPIVFGLVLIGLGYLFKIAASPFHYWALDVYTSVPTIVTAWLTTMPKISLLIFLYEVQGGFQTNSNTFTYLSPLVGEGGQVLDSWKYLLLVCSVLSLIVGSLGGLSQSAIKRILAYSTISHIGFLLLALALDNSASLECFLFYLIQYSLTNVNIFLILLALGYTVYPFPKNDIQNIQELTGQFVPIPILSICLAITLFSMAGIPPMLGFFAKYNVLYTSVYSGYYFISIVAIVTSVISASYYLKIISTVFIGKYTAPSLPTGIFLGVSPLHSTCIMCLTLVICLHMAQPGILLNSCHLLALSMYYY